MNFITIKKKKNRNKKMTRHCTWVTVSDKKPNTQYLPWALGFSHWPVRLSDLVLQEMQKLSQQKTTLGTSGLSLFSLNVVSLESSLPHPSPTSTLTAYPPQGLKGSSASSPLPEASTWLPPERDQKCLRNKISLVPFFMTKQPFFKASVMQLNNG